MGKPTESSFLEISLFKTQILPGYLVCAVCRVWRYQRRFTLRPVNSEALLFHWRVLPILLNGLTEEDRQKFRIGEVSEAVKCEFQVVDSIGLMKHHLQASLDVWERFPLLSMLTALARPYLVILGSRSRPHKDRRWMFAKNRCDWGEWGMLYCDLDSFPKTLPSVKGFGSAVGVHPKNCHLDNEERVQLFLIPCEHLMQ